ncbi:MAG: phosphoribosyl-AMP cyclohydrolase [Leptospira sp.]|nr:phosphoribosyl-AMP cyclohydrolase [Leptospira sp.]
MKRISVITQSKRNNELLDVVVENGKTLDDIVKDAWTENGDHDIFVDCDQDSVLIQTGENLKGKLYLFEISSILNLNPYALFPVVTLDEKGVILTQAFGNQESVDLTLSTSLAHYFSRSRNRIWKKGEQSGHTQEIIKVMYSETRNIFVFVVRQNVAACHTGYYSCFFTKLTENGPENIYKEKKFEPEKVYS